MPPAARVTDPTAHGPPLTGPGSSNVLVGGVPAWRAGLDTSPCPLSSGPVPHVTGTPPLGSTTVLVNGSSAPRQGDTIVENGPPNSIAAGAPTVQIG